MIKSFPGELKKKIPSPPQIGTNQTQILNRQDAKHANKVGRPLLRRPEIWAARQRSPTGKCFLTRIDTN
jgi:hypothetical protein